MPPRVDVHWTCPQCSKAHHWQWTLEEHPRNGEWILMHCERGCGRHTRMLYCENGFIPTSCQCLAFHREDTDEHDSRCAEFLANYGKKS